MPSVSSARSTRPSSARLWAALNADDPLAASADLLGEFGLTQDQPFAMIANDCAKIGGGTDKHEDTLSTFDDKNKMSTFGDILLR